MQFEGFSMLPPQDAGWMIVTGSPEPGRKVAFVKDPHAMPMHATEVHAYRVNIQSDSRDQILQHSAQRMKEVRESAGFRIVKWEVHKPAKDQAPTPDCREYSGVIIEPELWTSTVRVEQGMICSHPDEPAYVVDVGAADFYRGLNPGPKMDVIVWGESLVPEVPGFKKDVGILESFQFTPLPSTKAP